MIGEHNSNRFNKENWRIGLLRMIISMPFIYGMIIPVILLDLGATIYKTICFRLYNIPPVKRKEYVQYNRGKMEALNAIDKLNCHYCSYVNGVLAYARKVAAETERMWCPIRHKALKKFHEPEHHKDFVPDGKKEILQKYYEHYQKEITEQNKMCSQCTKEGCPKDKI